MRELPPLPRRISLLTTERLLLRPFSDADIDTIYQLVYTDPAVRDLSSACGGSPRIRHTVSSDCATQPAACPDSRRASRTRRRARATAYKPVRAPGPGDL